MMVLLWLLLLLYGIILVWVVTGVDRKQAAPDCGLGDAAVSVVVAAQNERNRIPLCLQALAKQDYPHYNVLIVDDHSTDGTGDWVQDFIKDRPEWRMLSAASPQPWKSSKKAALHAAIEQAQGEWLLLTDADCLPPPTWIRTIASRFQDQTCLVAGFSPQTCPSGSWWRGFLMADSLAASLVAAGTIGRGIGITCSGRNLAYRRSAWLRIQGFSRLPDSLSGDDDFIIQRLSQCGDILFCLSADSVVPAQGPQNWHEFLKQKKRHLSAGAHYPLPAQAVYGIYHLLNAGLWAGFLAGILFAPRLMLPFGLKVLLDGLALYSIARPLQQKLPLVGFLAWQPLFLLYHTWVAWHRWQPPATWR
ncbi:MAG: Beta-monoglucosyldiacylglycerol synthase [bacterium ADurb.Bin478]|nr:MAG: Beta-monoglucosyldiacylglycerol synthase [bacterium ADurb.Bin478]